MTMEMTAIKMLLSNSPNIFHTKKEICQTGLQQTYQRIEQAIKQNSTFRAKALSLLIPDEGPSLETSNSVLLPVGI